MFVAKGEGSLAVDGVGANEIFDLGAVAYQSDLETLTLACSPALTQVTITVIGS
jgi:hypothetical protein